MLTRSFRHIPAIGLKTEQRLWSTGVYSWDDFPNTTLNFSKTKKNHINNYIEQSKHHLLNNPSFFTGLLNANQHWRIFPHFRSKAAYIDIETTGLNDYSDHITTIALYDGNQIKQYVYDDNIVDFVHDLDQFDVLVTYNGKSFDIPFIERFFGIQINKAHIDLRYVLLGLGISGGLKKCELKLGIDRGDLQGVDGITAVYLWREYERNANEKALETLLAYNVEDVINLEVLLVKAYNLSLQKTPFFDQLCIPEPTKAKSPFHADYDTINKINKLRNIEAYY